MQSAYTRNLIRSCSKMLHTVKGVPSICNYGVRLLVRDVFASPTIICCGLLIWYGSLAIQPQTDLDVFFVCYRCGNYIHTSVAVKVSATTTAIKTYSKIEQRSPYKTIANIWRTDIRNVVSFCCSGANAKTCLWIIMAKHVKQNANCGVWFLLGSSTYGFWLNVKRQYLIWAFGFLQTIPP